MKGKLILTENDPDLPESSEDGGYINTEGSKFNPGQLVLALAEQVKTLGGCIVTNCYVQKAQDI